jgi:uncharacterized protein (DUF983 family)
MKAMSYDITPRCPNCGSPAVFKIRTKTCDDGFCRNCHHKTEWFRFESEGESFLYGQYVDDKIHEYINKN